MPTLQERCARVELLVLDVDGVLTAGGIVLGHPALELKAFHVRDGSGLAAWHRCGKRTALVTGRDSPLVAARAAELGIAHVLQGVGDKLAGLRRALADAGLAADRAAYVGDDWPDLPPLRACGLGVAVADACPDLRRAAHHVTRAPGGGGAVREVVELILRCQGLWQPLIARLRDERL